MITVIMSLWRPLPFYQGLFGVQITVHFKKLILQLSYTKSEFRFTPKPSYIKSNYTWIVSELSFYLETDGTAVTANFSCSALKINPHPHILRSFPKAYQNHYRCYEPYKSRYDLFNKIWFTTIWFVQQNLVYNNFSQGFD